MSGAGPVVGLSPRDPLNGFAGMVVLFYICNCYVCKLSDCRIVYRIVKT